MFQLSAIFSNVSFLLYSLFHFNNLTSKTRLGKEPYIQLIEKILINYETNIKIWIK